MKKSEEESESSEMEEVEEEDVAIEQQGIENQEEPTCEFSNIFLAIVRIISCIITKIWSFFSEHCTKWRSKLLSGHVYGFKNFVFISLPEVPGSSLGAGILTDTSFKSLDGVVSGASLNGIKDMGFTHMTEIQAKTIPHLLEGR